MKKRNLFEFYLARIKKKMRRLFLSCRRSALVVTKNFSDVVKRSQEKFYKSYRFYSRNKFQRIRLYLKYQASHLISHKQSRAIIAGVLLVVILVNVFQPQPGDVVRGATYNFVQSSWAGGASSTAMASHGSNQSGWNYYDSATNLSFLSSTNPVLTTSTYSATDDGIFTSTGDDTGGGFANGSLSNTSVVGSDSVQLATSRNLTINAFDTPDIRLPVSAISTDVVKSGDNLYVYTRDINDAVRVYVYSITNNTWSAMPDSLPQGADGKLAVNGTDLYVASNVSSNRKIYKHTLSDTTSPWEILTDTPGTINGAGLQIALDSTYMYVLHGGGSVTGVYRHVLSDTSSPWVTFAGFPASVGNAGAGLAVDEQYVYVVRGNNSQNIYRHDVSTSTGSWDSFATIGQAMGSGSGFKIDGSYMYVKNATNNFYRHTLSDTSSAWAGFDITPDSGSNGNIFVGVNSTSAYVMVHPSAGLTSTLYSHTLSTTTGSWTTVSTTNLGFSSSGGSGVVDNNNMYIVQGSGRDGLFIHSATSSAGAWRGTAESNFALLPATIGVGGTMVKDSQYVYMLKWSNTGANDVYRHAISDTSSAWTTFGSLNATAGGAGAGIATDGNFVYMVKGGGTTNVYRHSATTTTGAWTGYSTSNLGNISDGGGVAVNSSGVYILSGNNTSTVYYHTLSDTASAWTAFTNLPGNVSAGGGIMADDNYLYVLQGNSDTGFYRHSISTTTGSWDSIPLPAGVYSGSSMAIYGSYLYVQQGNFAPYNGVYRHLISTTTGAWDTFATFGSAPFSKGSSMTVNANGLYVVDSSNSLGASLYYHTLDNTSDPWIFRAYGPTGYLFNLLSVDDSTIFTFEANSRSNAIHRYLINDVAYFASGDFTSASIDVGALSFSTVSWSSDIPATSGANALRIQIATSSDNSIWSSFFGTDGTNGTYFDTPGASASVFGSARYIKYKAYLASANSLVSPALRDLTLNYSAYTSSGNLISSIYDSADTTNVIGNISWSGNIPVNTSIQYQIRTASTSALISTSTFVGPDGTAASYFTDANGGQTPSATQRDGQNDRFFQYKTFFATSDGSKTPALNTVTLAYIVNATPQIQGVTAIQSSSTSDVIITYAVLDPDTYSGTGSVGFVSSTFQYCNSDGSNCQDISSQMAVGNSTLSVNSSTFTTTTATWTPTGAFLNINNANAIIKVTINDNQAANNIALATSSPFVLDTAAPSRGSILVDASSTPAFLTIFATDSSTMEMKISLNNDLAGADWQPYATTSTIALATDPDTVYIQFRDVHNNTSSIYSVATPETPTRAMIQDISNVKDGATDYRLFFAWKVVANPNPGFASYQIYRSTDQVDWTLIKTETSRTSNFYTDSSLSTGILYYYRVITLDSAGNLSYYSHSLNGNANGTQDGDEGGGASAVAAVPTITNVTTSSVSQNSVLITWDTDVLSDSAVMYGTDPDSLLNTVSLSTMLDNNTSVGNHQVAIMGLTPNTEYFFKVISANVDGIVVSSTNDGLGFSFSTLNGTSISNVANPQVNNNSAIISWETNDSASEYVVYSTSSNFASSITVGSPGPYTFHSVSLSGLTAATNYFYYVYSVYNDVTSTDKNIINGNIEYYRFKTTNDITLPTVTNITESPLVNTSTVTWVTNKQADSQIIYGTSTNFGSTTTLDSTLTVQHSVTITDLLPNTLYYYKIRSTDANGLLGQSAGDRTFTTLAGTDATAPVISNVATSSVSLTGAIITWTTDEVANHLVDYGTSGSYGSLAGDPSDFSATSHSVNLTNLAGNTLYYFRVRSQDAAGNTVTSSQFSFTTIPDITNPIITNVTTAVVNQDSAVITWSTNELATSEVDYGTDVASLSLIKTTSTLDTTHSVTLTGLTKDTIYFYLVKSADASNNIASSDNGGSYYTFMTLKTPGDTITVIGGGGGGSTMDRVAPLISSVTVNDIGPDETTVKWVTDEESSSLVRYGTATSYGYIAGNDQEKVTKHSVVLKNLGSASDYHFKAVSYDASGNMGESVDTIFTTLNENGTVATSTQTAIEPSDSFFVAKIKNASKDTINTILEALNSNPSLKDVSEASFVKALTEMTDKVVLAPSIVGIKPQVEVKGTTASITWSTDKKSTTAVNYAKEWEYKASDPTPYTNMAVNADEFSTTHHIELEGLDPGTTYHYQVSSKGTIGPEARSKDYVFQTTSELPIISDVRVQKAKDSFVTISWRTNVPTAAILEYTNQRTKTTLSQGDTALLTNHEFTVKNLEGATTYSLLIKATDEFKNQAVSLPIKFSTVVDQIPPIISKLSSDSTLYPGKNSKIQTIISWETDEPATSQLFYQEGVQANGTVISLPVDTTLNTRHIIVATKFTPGAVYKYWVESKDLSGNTSKSETFSLLAPQAKETIVDIIIKNFEGVFGWTKNVGI